MMIKKYLVSFIVLSCCLTACSKSFPNAEDATAKEMVEIMVQTKGAEWVEKEVLGRVYYTCMMHLGSFKNKPKELDCRREKDNKNYEVFREEIIPIYKRNILNEL